MNLYRQLAVNASSEFAVYHGSHRENSLHFAVFLHTSVSWSAPSPSSSFDPITQGSQGVRALSMSISQGAVTTARSHARPLPSEPLAHWVSTLAAHRTTWEVLGTVATWCQPWRRSRSCSGVGPGHWGFHKLSRWFQCATRTEKTAKGRVFFHGKLVGAGMGTSVGCLAGS